MTVIVPWLKNLFREPEITQRALLSDPEIYALAAKVSGRTDRENRYQSHYMRAGVQVSPHRGSGMEFIENRLYTHGDNPRAIHWRLSARLNKLHSKVMTEDKESQWLIVSDRRPAMWFGTRVRLKVTQMAISNCLFLFSALASGRAVGHVLLDGRLTYKPFLRGLGTGMLAAHSICAPRHKNFASATPMSIKDALSTLTSLNSAGSTIIISSDFSDLDKDAIKRLSSLAARSRVIAIHIYDPAELQLPHAGLINVIDPTTQIANPLDTNHTAIRTEYHARANMAMENIKTTLRPICAHYVPLQVTENAFASLARFF